VRQAIAAQQLTQVQATVARWLGLDALADRLSPPTS